MIKALTGAHASAEAMRQIDPDVVAAFPITPQTPIMEKFADFVADGLVDTKMILVESEHSALSACVGACAAGIRTMTATSSAGLAYMWEILGIASGLRLPIVMNVVNRALSGPINIHCDHSDSMGCRDHGWIQIYSENAQEAYENTLLALRLAEKAELPVMVMQDGFITSHGVEKVEVFDDNKIKKYLGQRKPRFSLLDINNPVTFGALQLPDYNFETKRQEAEAMKDALKAYIDAGKELSKVTNKRYGFFEAYQLKDAQYAIVVVNSTVGTTKEVIDRMRKQGKKVGLLKLKLFRPFPYKEIGKALSHLESVAVLDRSESFGANAPIFGEIMNSLFPLTKRPKLHSCIFGLGGRNIFEKDIEDIFNNLINNKLEEKSYIGLK